MQFTLRRLIPFFFVTLFISSCNKPKTIIPAGILTEKEMVPVLVDIHVAQAAASIYNATDTSMYNMNEMIPYILSIHHIEKAAYDSSIGYYTRHPELMQQMYEEVINELSKEAGEVSSK
jgi:hypothetical protein